MIDSANFDLREELFKKEKMYHGKDDFMAAELLTFADKVNSPRANMFSSELPQAVALNNAEPPRVGTNYENVFGHYSTSYYKSPSKYTVIAKIPKFDAPGLTNVIYILVVYDEINKIYDVIEKSQYESLTEKYGFKYKTNVLDSKETDDVIEKDELLYTSTSFDDYGNFGYGINALTLYMIEEHTAEDAIICSKSLATKMNSTEIEEIYVSINDNDILINLYGDDDEYKPFPDIGESIKREMLCSKRRYDKNKALYDLKSESINTLSITDDIRYCHGKIANIDIYCNRGYDELPDKIFYTQIKKYYKMLLATSERIVDELTPIIATGKYSTRLSQIFSMHKNILDDNVKWRSENGGNFNNMIIKFTILRDDNYLTSGSKIAGRYGDKGVISEIWEDEDMPKLSDGRHVDMICNKLGVMNRLNPSQLYEVEVNFICNRMVEIINTKNTLNEKEEILFKLIKLLNRKQAKALKTYYFNTLTKHEKIKFFEDINVEGIYVHNPPFWNNIKFDTLTKIYNEFPEIEKYDVFIHRFGRDIKLINQLIAGEKYIMKLKHNPKSKLIIRSTGFISPKNLPAKSIASKKNQTIFPKNPIRFGMMETFNMGIGIDMKEIVRMNMLYRNSPTARRSCGQLFTKDILNLDSIKYPKYSKNINSQIFNILLKSIGMGIKESKTTIDLSDPEYMKGMKLKIKSHRGFDLRITHRDKGMQLGLDDTNKGLNVSVYDKFPKDK